MARDEVRIKVRPEKVGNEPESLEEKLSRIKNTKLQLEIATKKGQLEEIDSKIEELQMDLEVAHTFGVDDSQVDELLAEIAQLSEEKANLEVAVEDAELLAAKELEDSLNGEADFKVNVLQEIANSSDFMNVGQGFTQTRQGINDLVSGLGEVQKAGMQSEQNLGFLAKNLPGGMAEAKQQMQDINNIVASMPGDDNTMRSVLSTAQALGNNLNPDEMRAATGTMADYMQGSATMGKQALESQQDIMKYLLDGNTAELERGSIVSSQVDKLKEATTFQERQAAMQEVLNELGYGGIANLDTTINKQAEWEGMMYNAQDALSSMWLPLEQGAMDYFIKLDEGTGHLLSMGLVGAQVAAGPLIDIFLGLGQIGTGLDGVMRGFELVKNSRIGDFFSNLKTKVLDTASSLKSTLKTAFDSVATTMKTTVIPAIKDTATSLKTTLLDGLRSVSNFVTTSLIPALKNAALGFLEAGKNALISGYNALKSAAMWTYEKLALVASTIAEYGLAAAQAVLNVIMSLNPIVIVVLALVALAAALIWAYQNVDWFRAIVDGAWASLANFANMLWNGITSAINWVSSLFTQFTSQLGLNTNDWGQAILGFILFLPQLPIQLNIALVNAIARVLGFKGNFVQSLISAGADALSGFMAQIRQLYGLVSSEFSRIEGLVSDFITSLPQRVWDLGASIVGALKGALGIGSPGHMFYMIEGEFNRIDNLTKKTEFDTGNIGRNMVDNFNPSLNANGQTTGGTNNITINIDSVDSEDRIQEIVKAVEKALAFDNKTAGRSV